MLLVQLQTVLGNDLSHVGDVQLVLEPAASWLDLLTAGFTT